MEPHPVSNSTPKKAPLKSSKEYSSLKRSLHRGVGEVAKLQVPTCESTDLDLQLTAQRELAHGYQPTHKKRYNRKHGEYVSSSENPEPIPLKQNIREYRCRNMRGEEIVMSIGGSDVRVGNSRREKSTISFVYEPNSTKTHWSVTAMVNKQPWKRLLMSYDTNLPFREGCKAHGIKVINLQPGVPLHGTRQAASTPFNLKMKAISTNPRSRLPSIKDKVVTIIESESALCINQGEDFFMRCPWSESEFTFKTYTGEQYGGIRVVRNNDFLEAAFLYNEDSQGLKELIRTKQRNFPSLRSPLHSSQRGIQGVSSPIMPTAPIRNEQKGGLPIFDAISPVKFYQSSSPQQRSPAESALSKASFSSRDHKTSISRLPPSSPIPAEKSVSETNRSRPRTAPLATSSPNLGAVRRTGNTENSENSEGSEKALARSPISGENKETLKNVAPLEVESEEVYLDAERAPRSRGSPRKATRRARSKIEAEAEDEDLQMEPSEEDIEALKQSGFKPLSYKFCDNKSIKVDLEDIARLGQHVYVNDTIIWFYLKLYMERLTLNHVDISKQFLMLNTFFYFQMRNNDGVASWVTKIPFNEKRVIIMPVHEHAHWSVAVIYGLDLALANPGVNKATVLILDSLGTTRNYRNMRKVGTAIFNALKAQNLRVLRTTDLKLLQADVPTQTNLTDCGVFLLHYVEQILSQPIEFLEAIKNCSKPVLEMGSAFWQPDLLKDKRSALRSHLKDLGCDPKKNAIDKYGSSNSHEDDDSDDIVEILEHSNSKRRRVGRPSSAGTSRPEPAANTSLAELKTNENQVVESEEPEIGSLEISEDH